MISSQITSIELWCSLGLLAVSLIVVVLLR